MDPVTAVGLVTNVVQLVDVSWKIVSKSREIHRVGALPEQRDTKTVTTDLQRINNKLLTYLTIAEEETDLSEDDRELRVLCESSNRIATELLGRLVSVTSSDERHVWKSLRQALKSVWIKTELDETAARLQAYRSQLNTRILVSLQDKVGAIAQSNKNIASSIQESRVISASNQEIQTDYLTRFIASQHNKTRDLLSTLTINGTPPSYSVATERQASKSPSNEENTQDTIFKAVADSNKAQVRQLLRNDPQIVLTYNTSGQTLLHLASRKGDADMVAYLVRNGARINSDDDNGRLPIHEAVEIGSEPIVRILVNKGADSLAEDVKGQTARDLCSTKPLLQWILTYGARLDVKNESGDTALHHFASHGNLDAVRALTEQNASIETIGGNSSTPLWAASDNGHTAVVQYLLEHGAAVDARNDRRSTPLLTAAWHGYTRIGELLLDQGANIEAVNQHNYTPLHECLHHRRVDMAHMLLDRGAPVNCFNELGYAPLHLAAMRGHVELVRKILDRGDVDINVMNSRAHWTALAEACNHGRLEVVKLLLERGAATEVPTDGDCRTALSRAAEHNHTDVVRYMLEVGGADINATDANNRTALYMAVNGHQLTVTRLLLQKGPSNVDKGDKDGYTPLCRAAQQGRVKMMRILLEAGADPSLPGKDAWTPLHEAVWHGHAEAVQLLLQHKARLDSRNARGNTISDFANVQRRREIIDALAQHKDVAVTKAS